jgi:enoyl-CoA hydratase
MYPREDWEEKPKRGFMSTREFIQSEIKDNIAFVTISREDKLNALSHQVLKELLETVEELKVSLSFQRMDGLILTGKGNKAFVAGADVAELANLTPQQGKEISKLGHMVSESLSMFPRPTVACLNGHAMGGGLELALSCDVIMMTPNGLIAMPEVKLGLIPGFGGTQRLIRAIGRTKALDLIFTARAIKAEEAFNLGLVLRILPNREELMQAAVDWINLCSTHSFEAIAQAKTCLLRGVELPLHDGFDLEAQHFSSRFGTEEMKEGIKAFQEKRAPQFQHKKGL